MFKEVSIISHLQHSVMSQTREQQKNDSANLGTLEALYYDVIDMGEQNKIQQVQRPYSECDILYPLNIS